MSMSTYTINGIDFNIQNMCEAIQEKLSTTAYQDRNFKVSPHPEWNESISGSKAIFNVPLLEKISESTERVNSVTADIVIDLPSKHISDIHLISND
jgi:hypothetical protein